MAQNLLECYKNKLAVSEGYYSKTHNGEKLSMNKKMVVARLLENTNKYMTEAFNNSVGTQRSDMGSYKRFALNLVTVAVPSLIAFDLVMVQPMSSMSGYVNYIEYVAGTNKGATAQGDVFNSPFALGDFDKDGNVKTTDADYTAARVVEVLTDDLTLSWTPVARIVKVDNVALTAEQAAKITVDENGKITDGNDTQIIKAGAKVAYIYDNVVIPQNDLPILNAKMSMIPVVAKARRIAIYYSQIAAFQAKNDYGFDLGDQLAEQAVGRLAYEIDTEIVDTLVANAAEDSELVWSKSLPHGVSKQEHYAGFVEVLEMAAAKLYQRTKKFAPNYLLIAADIKPILAFVPGFQAATVNNMNGPYMAGTLNGLKVYVSPNMEAKTFVLGVNGNDMMTSAAAYCPYMPVVPTQLLGYADGAMSQGFSTMYDIVVLNKALLIAGRVTA